MAFIVRRDEDYSASDTIIQAVVDSWPMILINFVMATAAGIIVWALVRFSVIIQ